MFIYINFYMHFDHNHSYHLFLSPLLPTEPSLPNKSLSCFIVVCVCDSPHMLRGACTSTGVCGYLPKQGQLPSAALLRIDSSC